MSAEDGDSYELVNGRGPQTLLYDGNKFHRFKQKKAKTRVNFRDDTFNQRRCCSEEGMTTANDDLEIGGAGGLTDYEDDEHGYAIDENQLTVMTLPVEFMRRPSAVSIRMKKDQGTRRARRKPRVIFKNGFRNITFRKIPERSMLCFKDLVTTLVRFVLIAAKCDVLLMFSW